MYAVSSSASEAGRFLHDLASLARRHGMKPSLGRATDDHGQTLLVLEANGHWMKLWSQNVYLSGRENAERCGEYTEPHPDSGQYIIEIRASSPLSNKSDLYKLALQIKQELSMFGYTVISSPVLCSTLSKAG